MTKIVGAFPFQSDACSWHALQNITVDRSDDYLHHFIVFAHLLCNILCRISGTLVNANRLCICSVFSARTRDVATATSAGARERGNITHSGSNCIREDIYMTAWKVNV